MARTNAAAHARFSPDPNAAIGWPPSSPDNLLFASALSHFSVFSFLTAQVLNPSSGRLRQFASYTFALHRSLHPPTFFSSSSTPRLRPSKQRYSHNSSPRPPLLASRRNRKNQVRLQDMFGLTKARTSPRNPDHFPIAQLFLLGQYPATQKMLVVPCLTNTSPRTSCRANCPHLNLPLCYQARRSLWRLRNPSAFLCRHPHLCLLSRRGLHRHVLGRSLRSHRSQACASNHHCPR